MSITQKLINGLSDKILVRQAKSGNREAYGKLYMKYLNQIYRYIFFRVNMDRSESEDLTEVVFINAWKKITNGNFKNDNFKAFIYQIAHNIVIDNYRNRNKSLPLSEDLPDNNSPEESLLQKSGQKELLIALNKLPDDQNQVITMKFIEGMKNREIADILGKTNQAVRALQYRGLKQLKINLNWG